MGWNGSGQKGAAPVQPKVTTKKPSPIRGLIAGAVVVALAVGAFFIFTSERCPQDERVSKEKSSIEDRRRAMRKIVESKTGRPFVPAVQAEKPKEPEDLGWYTNKAGVVKRRTGKGFVIKAGPHRKPLFDNVAENQLSGIVNTPLGANCYDYDVPEDFEEQFAYSLTNAITITENDSPEDAEKKRRVIEAKEHLVNLKKSGADIRQVLLEEKKLLRQRFEDYQAIEQGLNELRGADATPEEIADYARAAKEVMKQHDIEHPLYLAPEESEAYEKLDELISPKETDSNPDSPTSAEEQKDEQ